VEGDKYKVEESKEELEGVGDEGEDDNSYQCKYMFS
jgi:hypothetical protein